MLLFLTLSSYGHLEIRRCVRVVISECISDSVQGCLLFAPTDNIVDLSWLGIPT